MSDVQQSIVDRYLAGWRPSRHAPGMWEQAVHYTDPDEKAPDPDDDSVPDPEREAMTEAEAEYLAAHGAISG
jgi:hypothetical protein